MPRIVLASGNAVKLARVEAALGARWEVVAFDARAAEDAAPVGYLPAATAKAMAARATTASPIVLAHDCGFEFAALAGEPGPRTARWLAEPGARARLREIPPGSTVEIIHCAVLLRDGRRDVLWERETTRTVALSDDDLEDGLPLTRMAMRATALDRLLGRTRRLLDERDAYVG